MKCTASSSNFVAVIGAAIIAITSSQHVIAATSVRHLTNIFADGAVNAEAIVNMTITNNRTAASDSISTDAIDKKSNLFTDESSNVAAAAAAVSSSNMFANDSDVIVGASALNMLDNQIICGYQGWFAFPGDGAPINKWRHWFHDSSSLVTAPLAEDLATDVYPTTDEYDDADLHTSGIRMKDGSYAKFYSSARPNVVLKHFQWMQTYGISGVFHLRFMQSIEIPANREWKTMVLRHIRTASEATGRIFAVSYNIAGTTDAILEDVKTDWIKLVDEENITQSSQYIRQNGLPVLRIYGIGFTAVNVTDTTKMAAFIKWFQTDAPEKYRVFLVGGVPSRWRDLTGDSRSGNEWKNIYKSLDGIHPWHVGRWSSISNFDTYHTDIILNDAAYCATNGIRYMPTMWPGFSWHNLKNAAAPINDIPRLGGTFMWRQAYKFALASNINTVWLAQFDECDEGTAIYKLTAKSSDLPIDGTWLALDADGYNVPSDHYLRLAGEAQKMLDGTKPVQATIPTPSPTRMPTPKPTTKAPTNKPTTKTPTGKPTTQSPTLKPTTTQPTSKSPTLKPTTTSPTSLKPTTASPSALKISTSFPTTAKPSTATLKPTSNSPTTLKPTTSSPTTTKPSTATLKPTTTSPTTSKPTTKSPTLRPTTKTPTQKPTKPTSKRTSRVSAPSRAAAARHHPLPLVLQRHQSQPQHHHRSDPHDEDPNVKVRSQHRNEHH
jgi:hypothetical protein